MNKFWMMRGAQRKSLAYNVIVENEEDINDVDEDDDETEMSWYEGTPGGSWRDMGARRKIQTWIARRDFLKNETILKMTKTMMMTKLVILMAMKAGDIDIDGEDKWWNQ